MISLTIDGTPVVAKPGEKILWVALDNGIYIPNLCAIRDRELPFSACRLCFVEIENENRVVTSCTEPVRPGMIVRTNTDRVRKLQRRAFELILTDHPIECKSCPKSGTCELQRIASYLKVKLKRPERLREMPPKELPVDSSHPEIIYNPNKCVLCGKCVWVCAERGTGILSLAYRGYGSMITTFDNMPLVEAGCNSCGGCVEICPVGAFLTKNSEKEKVI